MAKKNKPSRAANAVEQRLLPAVSVIIPMYNTEKYIGECLDSILAQTFQNFEVIVVDDCSTDSSYSIVESYMEKFGGRLKLAQTKANMKSPSFPREKGCALSRGDYVFFVDADDFITKNALEVLYTSAENFNADVVYTGSYYKYTEIKKTELERDKEGKILLQNGQEDKPTLTVDDPNKNIQRLLLDGGWFHTPWSKFVRREFLIEYEIFFPKIFSGEDFIWTIQVLYYAKKLLRLSTPIYYYREDASASITRKKDSSNEQIAKCVSAFLRGTKALHELSDKVYLLQNQVYFRAAINPFFNVSLKRTFQERMSLNTQEIYEILYREFNKGNDSFDLTVPFFFSVIDSQQKNLIQAQQQFVKFNQFASQAQKRIAELENEIKRLKGQA